MELNQLLDQLAGYIDLRDYSNTTVSKAPVDWHIDHALKVINNICGKLTLSNHSDYSPEENKTRSYVLAKKFIKRGIAEAPVHVRPPAIIDTTALNQQLEEARESITCFTHLNAEQFFHHHSLGQLNRDESQLFLAIHTRHHLEIIQDIVAGEPVS